MPSNANVPHATTDSRSEGAEIAAAFEDLALPLLDSLYNFARWIARDPHDAEDLVQETYLKAFRTFSLLQSPCKIRAWMFKILQNTYLNHCSKLERRMTIQVEESDYLAEIAVDDETPETLLTRNLDRQLVQSLIAQLPNHFKAVLLLSDVEEMSYRDIATTLELPIGTVMSRLSRARKLLRQSLALTLAAGSPQSQSTARKRVSLPGSSAGSVMHASAAP